MLRDKTIALVAVALVLYGFSSTAAAQVLNSPNYSIPESYIGPGGSTDSSSNNYQGRDTLGDVTTGQSGSTNYTAEGGAVTPDEPRLSVNVTAAAINFGGFTTSSTSTGTADFTVLNYTAHGYDVYIVGDPPSNGSYTLAGVNPTTTSQIGVEQYGINLVANTSPNIPASSDPSGPFGYGAAATGYNTANNFRYVAGEKIAAAPRSSGETSYTISFIVNVSTNTAGGKYTGSQSLVVVGTY